jgi:hypothetical protein
VEAAAVRAAAQVARALTAALRGRVKTTNSQTV